jgi:hypothetical protein
MFTIKVKTALAVKSNQSASGVNGGKAEHVSRVGDVLRGRRAGSERVTALRVNLMLKVGAV